MNIMDNHKNKDQESADELDLKQLWKTYQEEEKEIYIDVNTIAIKLQQIEQQGNSHIAALRKNIMWDAVYLLIFLIVASATAIGGGHPLIYKIALGIGFAYLSFVFLFLKIYNQLTAFDTSIPSETFSLKLWLQRIIAPLSAFVRWYLAAILVFTALSLVAVAWLMFQQIDSLPNPFLEIMWENPQVFLLTFVVISLAIGGGNFLFAQWYLQRMYGNYLEDLKKSLEELAS